MAKSGSKKKQDETQEHNCKEFVDTKWRLTTGEDWEPVLDFCQICGKIIHEYGEA